MPLAFFCTLFFRHRKKSVSVPWDGQSLSAPESARQSPPRGISCGKVVAYRCKQGGFPLAPLHPLRIASEVNKSPIKDASPLPAPESARQSPSKGNFSRQSCLLLLQAGGFPRGKQSARFALPCAPLVVYLNSGALTAFGGCIHWIPASLRSPQSPSDRHSNNRAPHGTASPNPRRSRRVNPHRGVGYAPAGALGAFLGANHRRGSPERPGANRP